MSLIETIIDFFTVEGPDENEPEEIEEIEEPGQITTADPNISLFEPACFEDAQQIAAFLKKPSTAAVISIGRMEKAEAQRLIDFLSGSMFILSGTMTRIASDEFVCSARDGMAVNKY